MRQARRDGSRGPRPVSTAVPPPLAPAVELGDLTLRGMHVTFGDMYIFDAWDMTDTPALLIGMDIIGLLDVLVIDYKRRELHLRARS